MRAVFTIGFPYLRRMVLTGGIACLYLGFSGCSSFGPQPVVIDAGHGGHDPGARPRGVINEKTANLDVAQRVEQKLRRAGIETVMTRRGDYFIPLNTRADISNRKRAAAFVSIHFNFSYSRRIRGFEVYYYSSKSRRLAAEIAEEFRKVPGLRDRGIKYARFRVLRRNYQPAVLVECGYLTHPYEGRQAGQASHRARLADAIADGIKDYLR